MSRKIYIASDHNGFKMKARLDKWLAKQGIEFEDLGNSTLDPIDDYPDFAGKLAKRVVKEKTFGIVLCGSAQGVCIAANKIKGAYAVIPASLKEAVLSREHNDANVLCLSGWFGHFHKDKQMITRFLTTPFSGDPRHKRRINKIKRLERGR